MTAPFAVKHANGLTFIDSRVDAAFKQALIAGVPPVLRGKMREALADIPPKNARAHCERYFAGELPAIMQQVGPLLIKLDHVLTNTFRLPGLFDWLNHSNLGNHYKLVKVFKAWSEFKIGGTVNEDGQHTTILGA